MSSEIKVNTGTVYDQIKIIKSALASFTTARENVISTINGLSGDWRGKAEEQFIEAFKEFDNEYSDMAEIIQDYMSVAQAFCQSVDETEGEYKNKFNSI